MRIISTILMAGIGVCTAFAQQQLQLRKMDISDGLRSNYVYTMLEDRQGLIWIGTERGLDLWPSAPTEHPDNRLLPKSGYITALLDHSRLGLVYSSYGEGVYYLDPVLGSRPLTHGLIPKKVVALYETTDNQIWMYDARNILYAYRPGTQQLLKHPVPTPLPAVRYHCRFFTFENALYFQLNDITLQVTCTDDSISIRPSADRIQMESSFSGPSSAILYALKDGNVYRHHNGKQQPLGSLPPGFLPRQTLMAAEGDTLYLIGHNGDVAIYTPANGYSLYTTGIRMVNGSLITRDHRLFLHTYGNGIYEVLNWVKTEPFLTSANFNNTCKKVVKMSDGDYFTGYNFRGSLVTSRNNQLRNIPAEIPSYLYDGLVYDIQRSGNSTCMLVQDALLCASDGKGTTHFHKKDAVNCTRLGISPAGIVYTTTRGVFGADSSGNIHPILPHDLSGMKIYVILVRGNYIVLGTSDGIHIGSVQTGHWMRILPKTAVTDLELTPHYLFAATYQGLYAITDRFIVQRVAVYQTLDAQINDLTLDEHNNLWVASSYGLTFLKHPEQVYDVRFFQENGGTEINALYDTGQEMNAYTPETVYHIRKNNLLLPSGIPPLTIRYQVNGKSFSSLYAKRLFDDDILQVEAQLPVSALGNTTTSYELSVAGYRYPLTNGWVPLHLNHLRPGPYRVVLNYYAPAFMDGIPVYQADVYLHDSSKRYMIRDLITAIGSILVLILVLYTGLSIQRRHHRKKLETISKINESEQILLTGIMNPHFINNGLNSIQTLIFSGDKIRASNYLSRFALLNRMQLDAAYSKKISLKNELRLLSLYYKIENLRFSNSIDISIRYHKKINIHDTFIPPFLIQPLVENAIKYSPPMDGRKAIQVFICPCNSRRLLIVIVNRTPGEINTVSDRISATSIIRKRLYLLSQITGISYTLRQRKQGDRVVTRMTIPCSLP